MTARWDVRTPTGALVTDLNTLAAVLRTGRRRAAKTLLDSPQLADAAPPRLIREAKAAKKPGGGTPPPISTGSFVSWSGGKGRVDLVVTSGKVPGVDDDIEGSKKTPAARVVVWEDGKPTRKKIAKSTHTLKRIPPLNKTEGKAGSPDALVAALAAHNARCDALGLPAHARVSGSAVKAVYDRGVHAWPGARTTSLSPEQWALGRVEHFMKVATGAIATKSRAGHDTDLLPDGHPFGTTEVKRGGLASGEMIVLTPATIESDLARIFDGIETD